MSLQSCHFLLSVVLLSLVDVAKRDITSGRGTGKYTLLHYLSFLMASNLVPLIQGMVSLFSLLLCMLLQE